MAIVNANHSSLCYKGMRCRHGLDDIQLHQLPTSGNHAPDHAAFNILSISSGRIWKNLEKKQTPRDTTPFSVWFWTPDYCFRSSTHRSYVPLLCSILEQPDRMISSQGDIDNKFIAGYIRDGCQSAGKAPTPKQKAKQKEQLTS